MTSYNDSPLNINSNIIFFFHVRREKKFAKITNLFMVSSTAGLLNITSCVLGLNQISITDTFFASRFSRKRNRQGNVTISSRRVPFCSTVNDPYAPLPAQFRIARTKKNNDFILFEGEGLVDTTLNFSISDRKALNLKNNDPARQLSLLYKISKLNLRRNLNNRIHNRFKQPANPANSLGLFGLKQVFVVMVHNVEVEVTLSQNEILETADGQSPTTHDYLRVLLYKIVLKFNEIMRDRNPEYCTAVQINPTNILASRGLFAEKPLNNIFTNESIQNENLLVENPLSTKDLFGRNDSVFEIEASTQTSTSEIPPERFTAFLSVALSLRVFQRQALVLSRAVNVNNLRAPTISGQLVDEQCQPNTAALNRLINGQLPQGEENYIIDSVDNMFLNYDQAIYGSYELNQGDQNQLGEVFSPHTVVIKSHRTDFSVVCDPSNQSVVQNFKPNFIFIFFETEVQFESVYVAADYFVAGLESVILRHIRACHSKLIIYNTLLNVTYEKKYGLGKMSRLLKNHH